MNLLQIMNQIKSIIQSSDCQRYKQSVIKLFVPGHIIINFQSLLQSTKDVIKDHMFKLNFQKIFDEEDLTQLNMTKYIETQAGSLTGRQSFTGQKLALPKDSIFIHDQNNHKPDAVYYCQYQNEDQSSLFKPYQTFKHHGQRMYYTHRENQMSKLMQLQKKKLQQDLKDFGECYFKPKIDKYSKAIIQNKQKNQIMNQTRDKLFSHPFTVDDLIIKSGRANKYQLNKTIESFLPTKQTKQMKQLAQCTFTPVLVSKSTKNINMSQKSFKGTNSVHQKLYDRKKNSEYRKRVEQAEKRQNQLNKSKKLAKNQFQEFLNRSQKFIKKKQKKNEILDLYANNYNLETGKKYFQPSLNSRKNYQKKEYKNSVQVNPQSGIKSKRGINLKKIQQVMGQLQNQLQYDDY